MKPRKLGHVVLRVRDLARSEAFYAGILGLTVKGRIPGRMTFLAAGEDSHDLALMQLGPQAAGPDPGQVGMYHFAYQVDTEAELSEWYRHLKDKGVRVLGTADHGVSHSIYFLDPDGLEVEVTYDLPPERWPAGNAFAGNRPLVFDEAGRARAPR